ncbi:DUF6264 family protein [Lysinibacter sp. HNR]|uniref:DUF6264 family protein n=1 Tax=Lysinibacter sp. HNR TaxID=3031408 RepID=UPI002435B22C|nr:DUF6264 family protein [Lysinibacter sp. HNR]WGD38323.1 DUF6264 family protein [Lysinibacter sp. HNR]
MATHNASDKPGSGSPPENRPKPQYGEYAPPGWSWTPEGAEQGGGVSSGGAPPIPDDASTARTPEHAPLSGSAHVNARQQQFGTPPRERNSVDLVVTTILLMFSFAGAAFAVALLSGMPQAFQMMYEQYSLGDFTEPAEFAGIVMFGRVSQVVLWIITVAISVVLLVRKRRAFYVPLLGGILSIILFLVTLFLALAADPTLMNHFSA